MTKHSRSNSQKAHHRKDNGASLKADAQKLVVSTAHVAGGKVTTARKRLTSAIENGKKSWKKVQNGAISKAKSTDRVIRANPYRSLGVAVGVGALIGLVVSRRGSKKAATQE
jgi:ElaB/YqjD/DUF883 family membrane-anchored ribosome-binding protein